MSKFKEFSDYVENKFNRKIQRLRCDRGTEYTNNAFENYCKSKGIDVEFTIANSPSQNGKAERLNRTLVERARTVLYESHLPHIFWNKAKGFVVFIINRCPTLKSFIPYKRWHNSSFDYSRLNVFGCDAYMLNWKHTSYKFDF